MNLSPIEEMTQTEPTCENHDNHYGQNNDTNGLHDVHEETDHSNTESLLTLWDKDRLHLFT